MLWKIKIKDLKKVKLQMMNTCLVSLYKAATVHVRTLSFKRVCKRKEINHQIQKKTQIELEVLPGALVVNTNQWLLMQKAFAAWINMKFVKVILTLIRLGFLRVVFPGDGEGGGRSI